MGPEHRLVFAGQTQVAFLALIELIRCRQPFEIEIIAVLVSLADKTAEGPLQQLYLVDAKQLRCGEVGLDDHAPGIDGQVADRCQVIEIKISFSGGVEFFLGSA